MSLTWTRWVSLFTVLLLATLSLPGRGDAVARAQGATFDCPAPAAASASPVAGPAEDAAASAVFPEGGGELTVFAAASLTDAFIDYVLSDEGQATLQEFGFAPA